MRGIRLLQVKNPWAHKRWKGAYSAGDTTRWTPFLKAALKVMPHAVFTSAYANECLVCCQYDPEHARQFDNGIFWIDYDSMLKFYRSIYFNWNPGLFASRQVCVQREQTSPRGGLLPCFLVSFLTATPRKLELESSRAGK